MIYEGMNKFLEQLDITFRRDPTNYRPRINKVLFESVDVFCGLDSPLLLWV